MTRRSLSYMVWLAIALFCMSLITTPTFAAEITPITMTDTSVDETNPDDSADAAEQSIDTAITSDKASTDTLPSPEDSLPVEPDTNDYFTPGIESLEAIVNRRNIDTTSVESIGMALFTSQSQAEIDALTPLFEEALAKQRGMTTQAVSDWKYAPILLKKLVNDLYLSKNINMTAYGTLKKGDVLLRRTGYNGCKVVMIVPLCKYWAFMYEHAGLYYGFRPIGGLSVYESTNVGGVQFKPVSTWQTKGLYVGIYRSRVSGSKIAATFERLIDKYGVYRTPYNYNLFDKYTDKALYCSQLVWKFYQMLGVNVDSNHPLYGAWLKLQYGDIIGNYAINNAVAPDEIGLSSNIYRMASGWNQ